MADVNDWLNQTSTDEAAAGAPNEKINMDSDVVNWMGGKNEKARLGLAVNEGYKRDAGRSSRILKLQSRTGLPEDLIDRNLDEIEAKSQEANFNADKFYQESPIVAQWMAENPNHFAAAKDDAAKLGYLERHYKRITQQFKLGQRTTELSDIGQSAYLGTITPDQRKRQAEIETEMHSMQSYEFDSFVENVPGYMANQIPIFGSMIGGQAKGALVGAGTGAGAAVVAGQLGPQIAIPEELVTVPAGAMAGGFIGWRYGAAVEAARMEASLAYLDFEKIQDENGNQLGRGVALGGATLVGAINGGLESVGLSTITRSVPGLRNLTRGGIKKAFKNPTVRRALTRYAKNVGMAMAGEGATEFLQEMVKISGQELLQLHQDGELQNASTSDILERIFSEENVNAMIESGKAGAGAGGGITATTSTITVAQDVQKANRAKANQQAFQAINEASKDIKMSQAVPEKTQEVLKRITESGDIDTVYAPSETWNEYFQSKGVDPEQAALEVLGEENYQAYQEAIQTGGDIAIPLSKYASVIAPSEHAEFFQSEIKTNPDEMNARQADEFIKQMDEMDAQKAADMEQTPEQTQAQTDTEQIQEKFTQQLMETGLDQTTASTNAQVISQGLSTLAERAGVTPMEMAERFGLQVARPELQGELAQGEQAFDQSKNIRSQKIKSELEEISGSAIDLDFTEGNYVREESYIEDEYGDLPFQDMAAFIAPNMNAESAKKAKAAGFDTENAWYHGSRANIEGFSDDTLGASTGAGSARLAHFFASSPTTASDYARASDSELQLRSARTEAEATRELDLFKSEMREKYGAKWVSKLNESEKKRRSAIRKQFKQSAEDFEASQISDLQIEHLKQDIQMMENNIEYIKNDIKNNKPAEDAKKFEKTLEFYEKLSKSEWIKKDRFYNVKDSKTGDLIENPAFKGRDDDTRFKFYDTPESNSKRIEKIKNRIESSSLDSLKASLKESKKNLSEMRKTLSKALEGTEGEVVYQTVLKLKDPLIVDFNGAPYREVTYREILEKAQEQGFDGVIFKNTYDPAFIGADRNDELIDVAAVFGANQVRSVRAKFEDLESSNMLAQDKRGRIVFNDKRQFRVELFKDADLSTFLHETGHFYLEVLGDLAADENANPQIRKDFDAILEWFGLDSRDQIETKHHEQWARGWEAYLMKGNAPSAELRSAFARFRAWLSSIYKKMKNLDVQLTPQVTKVMDRILATDEQIKEAQREQKMTPLFNDLVADGFSETEALNYGKALTEAKESAEKELFLKHLNEIQREQQKWWRIEKARVREEITAEINQERVYIALENLQRGRLTDGTELDPSMAIKLDRNTLVKDFGAEFVKNKLPRPYVYARKENSSKYTLMSYTIAADYFGFSTAQEFIDAITNAVPRKQEIENRVDAEMKKRHGDLLLNDTEAKAEAMDAVHNDNQAKLMQKEMEHLASQNFATLKGLQKKISKPVPKIDFVRDQAESLIAQKKIRDIKPIVYQRAEAKAATEAQDLFLKGDFKGAFDAKQRQLLNHEMYRAAVNARDNANKVVEYMSKFQSKNVRERLGKAGADYLEQIDSILDRFSFKKSVSLKSLDKQKSLLAWQQEQNDLGFTVDIPEKLLIEANRQHYMETTLDELTGIRDSVKSIEHLARLKNKLMASKKARDLQAAEDEIVAQITANHKMKSDPPDFAPDMKARIEEKAKGVLAAHTKMEFLFEYLDGNNPNGAAWTYLFKPFADAEAVENDMMREAATKMREIFSAYSRKERAMWYYKKEFIPAIDNSLNKANMMAVALNWGNEYNRAALMEGYGWNDSQVQAILENLDERDWQTVQKIWDFIDEFWPQVEAQEKELNGVAPPKVEATEVETKFGTFAGGYYPVIFDSKQSWRQSQLEEAANVKEMFGGNWAKAMTKHGHTKERTNSGGKPIKLELSGLTEHVSSVIHDLSHRKAVVDVSRIVDRKGVREAIESSVGREMYKQIRPWIANIAGDRRSEPTNPLEGFLSHARMGATVVNMGWKFTTAIVQFTGYSVSTKELGGKYALQGLKETLKNPLTIKESYKFMSERSSFMRDRLGNYDRDIRDSLKKLNVAGVKAGKLSVLDAYTSEVRDSYFAMIGYMDLAVSMPTWFGAYRKAMDGAVDSIEKGNEKEAIDYADRTVRVTQGAGAAKDLALVQRGNEAFKLFTMFYSYFSVLFNQFQKTTNQVRLDKNVPKFLGSMFLLWFFPAVIEDVILGRGPDDDADEEEWTQWFVKKQVTYPFQGIVLLRDVVNGMDQYGYSPSAAFDAFESMARTGKTGLKLATGDKDEIERKDIKSLFMTTGYLTGLPTRQIWLSSEYFYDWATGEEEPENPAEGIWRGLVTGKPRE